MNRSDDRVGLVDMGVYATKVINMLGRANELEQAHTNGLESFWSIMKRGYTGTYHHISPKRLHRHVDEFSGRHNVRPLDTIDQMAAIVRRAAGKRLPYQELIA